MKPLYTATSTATGGRAGKARSSDGALDVPLSMPKEMGGPGGTGTNPEQLFAAGYAACFESACRFVAQQGKKNITDSSVTARVGVGPRDAGGFGLVVELDVNLKGVSREEAEEIAAMAHSTVCPYSNAIRGNVDTKVNVV
jgi:osmotically inducible protein OsmC